MSSKENADFLMKQALDAGISNPKELANFMGQMQVESGGFARMSENLNYSGARLLAVFPGRNGMDTAREANAIAADGPEAIANAIYGGAWGKRNLGNTEEGDGWSFRGRGYVQLTGRANYERLGRELGLDLVGRPELAADREVAAKIAIHYWQERVVPNGHQQDVRGATHDINGGYNHLAERKDAAQAWESKIEQGYIEKYVSGDVRRDEERARTSLADRPTPDRVPAGLLEQGDEGPEIRELQQQLNGLGYRDAQGHALKADGDFGKHTKEAVEAFQRTRGLEVDGIVGPRTMMALHQLQHKPQLTNPVHPDHALYQQALKAVHQAEEARKIGPGLHSVNLAAALMVEVKREGISRVDRVELNSDGTLARAVQVSPTRDESPLNKNTDAISTKQAITQPVRESSEQLEQVNVNLQARQAAERNQGQSPAFATP